MIIGTGTDLIDIRRIEKTLDRFGDRFTQRCFTEIEQAKSDRRKERAASYAKRYAAKEAGAKALGTGIARGVSWKEIGVVNLPGGKPTLELKGRALDWLARLTPDGMTASVHISITDEPPYALANVIIEALPEDPA
ncbi:holo-ACP synthase [Hyphobacterium sp.]|uniref:holo-ACP synthase n=1 Tax=Hyphobacterium sp. TaxID=2004662 RepID=UPI003747E508